MGFGPMRSIFGMSGFCAVGKTALIEQFARELPCVFFAAVESDACVNLRNLSRELYAFGHPGGNPEAAPVFPDFYTAFEAAFDLAQQNQVVFVVDEFPCLAKADAEVPSYLQALVNAAADARHYAFSRAFPTIFCWTSPLGPAVHNAAHTPPTEQL